MTTPICDVHLCAMMLRPHGTPHYRCPVSKCDRIANRSAHDGGWRITDAATRLARAEAHRMFDPLWQTFPMRRSEAYAWLRRAMGLSINQCHISHMDAAQCKRVIELATAKTIQLMRKGHITTKEPNRVR